MFLFDTDTLSNLLKKVPSSNLLSRLAKVKRHDQFTTSITVGEMVYGAFKSDRPDYFLEKLDNLLLPNLTILPFDEAAARKYGELRADLERTGIMIGEPDLRIASICLIHQLILITGNLKHFIKIKELEIQNWL
jgi:tRNA(fMet)-specific endonuclease VapC